MHIGILTGGGDCPGLNAVIRAWLTGTGSPASVSNWRGPPAPCTTSTSPITT